MPKGQSVQVYQMIRNYFVDEAGDGNLFAERGRVIVETPGCSRYFILGMLDIPEPESLDANLAALRAGLLADPYFKHVPSMHPEGKKTALSFHAKDDLPEIRREVFKQLMQHDLRFFAVVRDKHKAVAYVHQRNTSQSGYRYHPNELYDYMVRRLFKNLLHKDDGYNIHFSKRGKEDRTIALVQALDRTRQRFAVEQKIRSAAMVKVLPQIPHEQGGLQAVDYFLWALQRFYERREDRYLEFIWPSVHLVHDLDDTRENAYGVYYTQKRPLTLATFDKSLPGI
jgi:hypothetical protein